jgi:5-methylthioadenosine/S-adenosylhomocysteine deaminase
MAMPIRAGVLGLVLLSLLVPGLEGASDGPGKPPRGDRPRAGFLIRRASLVLTMDPTIGEGPLGQLAGADVLIVGDRIEAVGRGLRRSGVRVLDGRGLIVMPGFVDTHDHLWQTLIRGCAADADLIGWLERCVFPLNAHPFSERDAYAGVRLGTTGLIATGVTTVVDWSHNFNPGFTAGNLRALNDSGLRYHFAQFGAELDGSDVRASKARFVDPNPLGTMQVASHPSPPLAAHMRAMVGVAGALGVKLHVHLLENAAQRDEDAFRILEESGALDLGGALQTAHTIHLTREEIARLAAAGATVSHQPLSNMRLASGIMPLPDLTEAGAPIGLGLDGGTNDTPDMFSNLRAAIGLQRAKTLDAGTRPTVSDVLRMATMGGAELLGIDGEVGSLTPGKQADVVVIDPGTRNFSPLVQPINQIVFNGQPRNVRWVFVAGRALKQDGRVAGVDERRLLRQAQIAADHIGAALVP